LIIAFNKLNNKNIYLLIIGGESYSSNKKTQYIKEIQNISLNSNIIYTGYVDYEIIHKYYQLSDIGVIPSTWEEPFALSCLEFLASGAPVIISNSGGMIEVVNKESSIIVNKENSFAQNLFDALNQLILNKDLRKTMSNAAKNRAQFFNSTIYYDNLTKIITAAYENNT